MKRNRWLSFFASWEFFLATLLAVMCALFNWQDAARQAAGLSKRDVFNFASVMRGLRPYMLYSFMTLGMMLILAMGDIDISVGALGAFSVAVLGLSYKAATESGVPNAIALAVAIAACLGVGVLGGAMNGLLVTRFKELFPMIITLATQLFFRGFSYLLLGGSTLTFKNDATFDLLKNLYATVTIGSVPIPIMIFAFLGCACLFHIWLHLTANGRRIFAIGANRTAALYSGIRVDAIKMACFIAAGFLSAVTGIFFVGATSSSIKADIMSGYELFAIGAAILGGFSTNGGKGSVPGCVLSLIFFGVMKIGLGTLFGIADSAVNMSVGIILILSVFLPNLAQMIGQRLQVRRRRANNSAQTAA
ncbi:branched-chain amino acid ABC transporter permease [Clostridia bacterium]|nr:branched-chain amino acid ABC transporter permease [Clostridia bacterium]